VQENENRVAALANMFAYDEKATKKYMDGAPHIKHAVLRNLYAELLIRVFDYAKKHGETPKVLDLGAGEGEVTLPFLELGAEVTAVDISRSQLDSLAKKAERHGEKLKILCEDVNDALKNRSETFDIIVVNSFLHHIPDFLGLIDESVNLLSSNGQFFSFQDPLRYDSIGRFDKKFTDVAYYSWRVMKGDLIGGIKRKLRRNKGVYLEESMHDNAEYHVVRNGVDQDAIEKLFRERGFQCEIISYFSTQSGLFQPIGKALSVKNTFAVIARKKSL